MGEKNAAENDSKMLNILIEPVPIFSQLPQFLGEGGEAAWARLVPLLLMNQSKLANNFRNKQ